MTGSKPRLFKGNPGFSTKKIQIRVPGISPAKKQNGNRLSNSRLGELRIENYVFWKLKVK